MGSKILFNTVFINLEQVVHFLLCRLNHGHKCDMGINIARAALNSHEGPHTNDHYLTILSHDSPRAGCSKVG